MKTLEEFVDTYFAKTKTNQSYGDYKSIPSIVKGHMNIKGKLKWSYITRDFLDEWRYNMENGINTRFKKPLSNDTIKSYAVKLQHILNDAVDREIIAVYPRFPKELKTGGRKRIQNPKEESLKTTTRANNGIIHIMFWFKRFLSCRYSFD